MLSLTTVVAVGQQQVSSELNEEAVILNFANGVYYGLNPLGTHIWRLIQQPMTVDALCTALEVHYEVDRAQLQQDVMDFLNQMIAEGLVEVR